MIKNQRAWTFKMLSSLLCLSYFHVALADEPQARLTFSRGLFNETYFLAIDLHLPDRALTYWRNPGEAGVASEFLISNSANLASYTVKYPMPSRLQEASGLEVFGYRGHVTFPLLIKPKDPHQPLSADLDFNYAICEKLCVPQHTNWHVELTPGLVSPEDMQPFFKAMTMIPMELTPQQTDTIGFFEVGKGQWRIVLAPYKFADDLFAEAPEGWYFKIEKSGDGRNFLLQLVEMPKNSTSTDIRFTARGKNPFEFTHHFDMSN